MELHSGLGSRIQGLWFRVWSLGLRLLRTIPVQATYTRMDPKRLETYSLTAALTTTGLLRKLRIPLCQEPKTGAHVEIASGLYGSEVPGCSRA